MKHLILAAAVSLIAAPAFAGGGADARSEPAPAVAAVGGGDAKQVQHAYHRHHDEAIKDPVVEAHRSHGTDPHWTKRFLGFSS